MTKGLKLRSVAERRHNGGLIVKVFELAASGTFTLNLRTGDAPGELPMFGSVDEARRAADERLLSEGHDCTALGCQVWTPGPGSRS
jgi:hypothetical protein